MPPSFFSVHLHKTDKMKIVYLHGFGSSGTSGTVELLRKSLPEGTEVVAPDIPVDPREALPFLHEYCKNEQPDLVLGTSMGGMYTQQMWGFKRICVNPAFTMSRVLKAGKHKFFNRRKDNQTEFFITKDIIQAFNQMERMQFKGITKEEKELCWGLFAINDTYPSHYDTFRKLYPHCIRFEGEHQLNDKVLHKVVFPLIKEIMGE